MTQEQKIIKVKVGLLELAGKAAQDGSGRL